MDELKGPKRFIKENILLVRIKYIRCERYILETFVGLSRDSFRGYGITDFNQQAVYVGRRRSCFRVEDSRYWKTGKSSKNGL